MFNNFHKKNKGVTLVELMVVIAILAIMFATILANYKNSRFTIVTQNLADDIALSVRKAQSYAIGVRSSSNSFNYGYGIHFSTSENTSNPSLGSNKAFILFTDISNLTMYDKDSSKICGEPKSDNECLEILQITSGDKIAGLNIVVDGNVKKANDGVVDITFKRPSPEPKFCYRKKIGSGRDIVSDGQIGGDKDIVGFGEIQDEEITGRCNESKNITAVQIIISNDTNPGVYKTITISNTGQISVL